MEKLKQTCKETALELSDNLESAGGVVLKSMLPRIRACPYRDGSEYSPSYSRKETRPAAYDHNCILDLNLRRVFMTDWKSHS